MATKKKTAPEIKFVAKCVSKPSHRFTLTKDDIRLAKLYGAPMCPECGNIATIVKVTGEVKQ